MPLGREQQASAEDALSDAGSNSGYDSDDARLREVRALSLMLGCNCKCLCNRKQEALLLV
jgi:hypothetical protein